MNSAQLNAIKARYEAATEGPWKICKEDGVDIIGNDSEIILELSGKMLGCTVRPYNFKFIAHARTDLPACTKEVERLKGNQDKLITACEQLMCCIWHEDCAKCPRERECNFADLPSNPAKTTLALIAKIREQA